MSQRLLWQLLFEENRSQAQLSLGEVRIMLHRLVEVLLSLVGLSVLSAHFSQLIRSIGIVGMRAQLLFELLAGRRHVVLRLTLPKASHQATADAIMDPRPIWFELQDFPILLNRLAVGAWLS